MRARTVERHRPTDLPEDLVGHVPPGRLDPARLEATLRALVEDPERRKRIGEAARAHVLQQASAETTAHVYAQAIDGTLGLLRDPTRRALARWGGALVDLGVTEQDLAEGYGVSYARALEEFRPTAPGG
jgi:glycosyltransferase involved in cell wall biosynthesis